MIGERGIGIKKLPPGDYLVKFISSNSFVETWEVSKGDWRGYRFERPVAEWRKEMWTSLRDDVPIDPEFRQQRSSSKK